MEVRPGYKQTEVGVIPEEWERKPIGSFSAFVTKGATPTTYGFNWETAGVLFLRSECVSENGLDLTQSMFISEAAHAALCRGEVRSGDILITITGNVGRAVHLKPDFGFANINQHIARIRVKDPAVLPDFVYHWLSQPGVRAYYTSITTGQAYPQISLKQVRETKIPLPSLPEQRAIAGALGDVDALLGALEKLIAKKRDLKQAAMQQLLTGKTRLPGFHGEWEVKRLEEVFSIFTGKSKSAFIVKGGRYWVVDMGSVSTAGRLIVSKTTNYSGDFLKTGDLIMPKDDIGGGNIIGKVGYIDADDTYVMGDHVYCLRAKDGDPLFLSYAINDYRTNTALRKKVIGSAQLGLGRKSVEEQEIFFPMHAEQNAIATMLSDMDAEIATLEQRLAKTRALKHGMMQELLTGKTRLI